MKMLISLCCLVFATFSLISEARAQQKTEQQFVQSEIMVRLRSDFMDRHKAEQALASLHCEIIHRLLSPEESITFNPSLAFSSFPIADMNGLYQAEYNLLRTYRVRFTETISPENMCAKLAAFPAIEIAEPISIESLLTQPNDPLLSKQQDYLDAMKVLESWEITQGSEDIIIAVVDNGIDTKHVDLADNLLINAAEIPNDNIDNDNNGYVDDYSGVNLTWRSDGSDPNDYTVNDYHGTSSAGNACAVPNNAIGVMGTGFRSKLLAIKAGKKTGNGISEGYEGIMYAAKRGAHVISCSWGTAGFYSTINNSIVQYAISRGCAVIASAGNTGNTAIYYPANYPGVLGVGNSSPNDILASSSSYGVACDIIAPGQLFYTLFPNNAYNQFDGTSSACPLVAGIVAVARSRFPQYSGLQICEHVRRTGDPMVKTGLQLDNILPLRVNMLQAITEQPTSHSAIVYKDIMYSVRRGKEKIALSKFLVNDTVEMRLIVQNRLADAANTTFTCFQPENIASLRMLDSVVTVQAIPAGTTMEIGTFSFIVQQETTLPELLRFSIATPSQKPDFFLVSIIPVTDMTDFATDSLSISAGDNGQIGYTGTIFSANRRGKGLMLKTYDNVIFNGGNANSTQNYSDYSSGLIVTDIDEKPANNRAVSAFAAQTDFSAVQEFSASTPTVSVITDTTSTQPIGIEIHSDYAVNNSVPNAIKIIHKLKNISSDTLNTIALGYFFDIDLGNQGLDNSVALFPEAIPEGCNSCAAEIVSRVGNHPHFGFLVRSDKADDKPAAAGVRGVLDDYIITQQEKITLLNSGTALQTTIVGDVQVAIGTQFSGDILPTAERTCEICIGAAWSKQQLAQSLQQCMSTITSIAETETIKQSIAFPNPTNDILFIHSQSAQATTGYIMNILGEKVLEISLLSAGNNAVQSISLAHLPNGIYTLRIGTMTQQIILSK